MSLGFPCDLTIYKLFTDWGSLIAGLLALLAGVLAYRSGVRQADSTRDATEKQLAAQKEQRAVEAENIHAAVRAEVIAFSKYIVGTLSVCEGVARLETVIPRSDANAIVRSLLEPTIFPAVADRVAVLPSPHLPVQFFMRIGEAKALANTLALSTVAVARAAKVSAATIPVTRDNVLSIADSLITALQLARGIVADVPANAPPGEDFVTATTLQEIDTAMASARAVFPDAESFTPPINP